jgi:hypothetical protein
MADDSPRCVHCGATESLTRNTEVFHTLVKRYKADLDQDGDFQVKLVRDGIEMVMVQDQETLACHWTCSECLLEAFG